MIYLFIYLFILALCVILGGFLGEGLHESLFPGDGIDRLNLFVLSIIYVCIFHLFGDWFDGTSFPGIRSTGFSMVLILFM